MPDYLVKQDISHTVWNFIQRLIPLDDYLGKTEKSFQLDHNTIPPISYSRKVNLKIGPRAVYSFYSWMEEKKGVCVRLISVGERLVGTLFKSRMRL